MLCVVQIETSAMGRPLGQGNPTECVTLSAIKYNSNLYTSLGELGRTPLYAGLQSAWGSVDGDLYVFPHMYVGGLLFWGTPADMNE
jgi:hypothetical protein